MRVQIVTGLLLATRYTPDTIGAFQSVIVIVHDVPGGWVFRNLHANGASVIFIFLYLHVMRGFYYRRYRNVKT